MLTHFLKLFFKEPYMNNRTSAKSEGLNQGKSEETYGNMYSIGERRIFFYQNKRLKM